jgi:hypothetical protein
MANMGSGCRRWVGAAGCGLIAPETRNPAHKSGLVPEYRGRFRAVQSPDANIRLPFRNQAIAGDLLTGGKHLAQTQKMIQ